MSPFFECEEEYTKCHECGKWDGHHLPICVTGLREAYLADEIDVDEFEARLDEAVA